MPVHVYHMYIVTSNGNNQARNQFRGRSGKLTRQNILYGNVCLHMFQMQERY